MCAQPPWLGLLSWTGNNEQSSIVPSSGQPKLRRNCKCQQLCDVWVALMSWSIRYESLFWYSTMDHMMLIRVGALLPYPFTVDLSSPALVVLGHALQWKENAGGLGWNDGWRVVLLQTQFWVSIGWVHIWIDKLIGSSYMMETPRWTYHCFWIAMIKFLLLLDCKARWWDSQQAVSGFSATADLI